MTNVKSLRFLYWNILKLQNNAPNKQSHNKLIAEVIFKLKPNIVSLCEVSDKEQLDYIKTQTSTYNHIFSSHFVKSTDTRTYQNTGLLTTIVPTVVPYVFSKHISKHYVAQFKIEKLNIALISCHLISNPQCEIKMQQREKQAHELKIKVESLIESGYEVLLAGDLNDFDNDVRDASSSKSMTNVLSIIKMNGLIKTTNNLIKHKDRYTYTYENKNIMIDHVLMTNGLYKLIKKVSIHHIKEKTIDDSDHDPIIIDFSF